jgi:hypothetical protein
VKLPHEAAEAASDSVGGLMRRRARSEATRAPTSSQSPTKRFVDAMTTAAGVAAGVALFGALVAAAFLPSRAIHDPELETDGVLEPAAA